MSCWVVPSVAAELWGIPVERIQAAIRDGGIGSKHENGFTFIDVAPDSPVLEFAKPAEKDPAPPTYRVVTHEEMVALVGDVAEVGEDETGVENWRVGRSEASRIRRPPESLAA